MTSPSAPESVSERLQAALGAHLGETVHIGGLQRLSGGASRETWSFQAAGMNLILRRDPPGRPGAKGTMRNEADVMRACHAGGLAVPEVVLDDDGEELGTAGLIMQKVDGETLARKILRDSEFSEARTGLLAQIATFMAGLHSIETQEVPGTPASDELATYRGAYQLINDPSPVFDKAFEWLEANRPVPSDPVLVHGDLRMGNVIVDKSGLTAVIDWELMHLGDPVEDLAWFCVKAWRFGSPLEAGGLGTIEEFIEAYEQAADADVDRDRFRWWLTEKTLQWGVICMGQAWAHLSGMVRSHELAAVGRRVAEQEWDLIELLAADATMAALAEGPIEPTTDVPTIFGRPTARELVAAVEGFLTEDVIPGTSGRLSYHARVAANMLAVVGRELSFPADAAAQLHAADDSWDALAKGVRAKLQVANPKYLGME